MSPLTPGVTFAGRFVIDRLLGVGGMGAVFAARHLELDQLVAVKVMLPEIAANAETAARFLREARASVRIKSDYVVRVLDVSRLEDGTPYMVMEYLEGSNLEQVISRQGPLDVETAAGYLIQACDAIAAAHAIGIVHRDLKPQNLFLSQQGDETHRIKVLDFGISKISDQLSRSDAMLTKTSCTMGSPVYMSPEQMQSAKDVDLRADIWALGCTLFELVTGRPPFVADTMPELCAAVMTQAPPLPSELHRNVPRTLDAVVLRCLEKDPNARYASVGELAQGLLVFAPQVAELVASISRRRSSLPPRAAAASMPPLTESLASGHQTQTAFGQKTGGLSRRRATLAGLGLAAVALLVVSWSLAWVLRTPTATKAVPAAPATAVVAAPGEIRPVTAQPSADVTVEAVPSASAEDYSGTEGPKRAKPGSRAASDARRMSAATPQSSQVVHAPTAPAPAPSAAAQPPKKAPSLEIGIK